MTSLVALSLVLHLATGDVDGGTRAVDEVATGTLQLKDGNTLTVSGGAYLTDESLLATGRELSQLRAENAALKAEPPTVAPSVVLVVVAAVVGLGLGLGLGIAIKR